MARPGISFEQVAQAADSMIAEGQQPTIQAVRERLGTGSPNTIHRHLTTWRAARPQVAAAVPELPASLSVAIAAEIERAAAQARAEIEGRLVQCQTEAADLAAAGELLEGERDALNDQVAALTTERDTIAGKATQQAADLTDQAQRIEREQQAAESARVELATARLKTEAQAERQAEQAQEIERLRTALEAATAAKVAGEQSAAVLAAQLDELRSQLEELRHGRTRLETERDQAREQAHQAQGTAREQARQIEQHATEIQALRGQVEELSTARARMEAERDQAQRQAGEQATEIQALRAQVTIQAQPTTTPSASAPEPTAPALELEPTHPEPKRKAPSRRATPPTAQD